MAGNPDRLYDKTHLSLDQAEERGFIHRDYIAHCFRWSHVVKFLMRGHQYKNAHILDVGCGKDQPLPRLMYANKMTGFDYTGVDMNKMEFHDTLAKAHINNKIQVALLEETDSSLLTPDELPWGLADFIVCFEVLEHMQPFIVHRMLHSWKRQLKEGGYAFVSTPVYNGSAAANHINEMGRRTLGGAFEAAGFTIVGNYGTFASQTDLRQHLTPEHADIWHDLAEYYDTNVLSTVMAPLYPQGSRNNLWVLKNVEPTKDNRRFVPEVSDANQNPDIADIFTGEVDEPPSAA